MPRSIDIAIKEESGRFVSYAEKQNPNFSDLGEFKDALLGAFNTPNGRNATQFFNDAEIKALFESSACKEIIRKNAGEREYNQIYADVEQGQVQLQRDLPKGQQIKPNQIRLVSTPKKVSVITYKRHIRGVARPVKAYNKGYSRWQPAQVKFIKVRKAKQISSRQIITDYNKQFKDETRSKSSIKTKIYRS